MSLSFWKNPIGINNLINKLSRLLTNFYLSFVQLFFCIIICIWYKTWHTTILVISLQFKHNKTVYLIVLIFNLYLTSLLEIKCCHNSPICWLHIKAAAEIALVTIHSGNYSSLIECIREDPAIIGSFHLC